MKMHVLRGQAAIFVWGLLLFLCSACSHRSRTPDDAIRKACSWLWNQQGDDGGWHSETHAILRNGQSLTPFILHALLQVPDSVYRHEAVKVNAAYDFVRRDIDRKKANDSLAAVLDYPNYSAAYALQVLVLRDAAVDSARIRWLTEHLISQQFVGHRGVDTAHVAYGAWGFGETSLEKGETGHVDLSHTRRVIEAMSKVLPRDHGAYPAVLISLSRLQNRALSASDTTSMDGGFYSSVVIPETNKSRPIENVPGRYESYATATCDGLLALHAAGVSHSDPGFQQAVAWLARHQEVDSPQGIPEDDPLQWHLALRYYHLMVRAEVCRMVTCDEKLLKNIAEYIMHEQRRDGSFYNPHGLLNKEDDPLLATAFAIVALAR